VRELSYTFLFDTLLLIVNNTFSNSKQNEKENIGFARKVLHIIFVLRMNKKH